MKLADLKGEYDAVFSLGDNCLASIQLEKNNLRPYAGVLDWVASPYLPELVRLIQNRFSGFMEYPNLRIGGHTQDNTVWVTDDAYYIVSSHDFDAGKNSLTELATYPEVKEKYDRRIKRFLEKTAACERILFVRTEGSFEEAAELQKVLSDIVKNDCRVLLVNHTNAKGIVENDWPLERICAIELPDEEKWFGNDLLWKTIFDGVHYVEQWSKE